MKPFSLSRLSIRQRLTLLICTLLLSVILVFGWLSYVGVKKEALAVGYERLQTVSEQLSSMLTGNARTAIATTYTFANRSSIKQYLLSGGKDSVGEVRQLLEEIRTDRRDTSNVQVELRDASYKEMLRFTKPSVRIGINIDSLLSVIAQRDSGRVGKLYSAGNIVCYPIVTPVVHQNSIIGYFIRWRKTTGNPRTLEQLSKIIGTEGKLYVGNADGSLWTDMFRIVSPPLGNINKNTIVEYAGSGNNRIIATVRPIANTDWLVGIELSKGKMLESPTRFLYWLTMAGSLLLIAGVFTAWLLSRNITRPIKNLTTAASDIAGGNYLSQVRMERGDELGKLATAFNAMSIKVQNSQKALEKKAENYKLLFENNPMPMWILSRSTLTLLDVNNAAIRHYGYTRDEFLQLRSTDLRPEEDVQEYIAYLAEGNRGYTAGVWRHKKKNGTNIMVDVIADDITYNGEPARLILANDITEKLRVEAELVRNRIMQQELITETTIQAQEKEREELGKELHDNINQILASTKLYLELARNGNEEILNEAIEKSYDNVNLAIGEIRQLSKQLVPPSLDNTLENSITELADEIKIAKSIPIVFTSSKFNEKTVDETIKLMLYRVVQEQMNNILKHARATEVAITLETSADAIHLMIEDNGVGFDPRTKSKGIGLRNIDSRVKFHNGAARIISQTGHGCRLEVTIPLRKQAALVTHAI